MKLHITNAYKALYRKNIKEIALEYTKKIKANKMDLFVKHECPSQQQSPKLAIFSMKVKVTRSLTMVSVLAKVKYFATYSQTERVTDKTKTRYPRLPFRGHKRSQKTHQILDFGMEPNITTLLPTCF